MVTDLTTETGDGGAVVRFICDHSVETFVVFFEFEIEV